MKTMFFILILSLTLFSHCLHGLEFFGSDDTLVSYNNSRATWKSSDSIFMHDLYECIPYDFSAGVKNVKVNVHDTCNTKIIDFYSYKGISWRNVKSSLTIIYEANVYEYPEVDTLNRMGVSMFDVTFRFCRKPGDCEDYDYHEVLTTSKYLRVPKYDTASIELLNPNQTHPITISPNPFNAGVNISANGIMPTAIGIYDINGALIRLHQNTRSVRWNSSGVPGSIFFVRVRWNDGVFHKKIIRVH